MQRRRTPPTDRRHRHSPSLHRLLITLAFQRADDFAEWHLCRVEWNSRSCLGILWYFVVGSHSPLTRSANCCIVSRSPNRPSRSPPPSTPRRSASPTGRAMANNNRGTGPCPATNTRGRLGLRRRRQHGGSSPLSSSPPAAGSPSTAAAAAAEAATATAAAPDDSAVASAEGCPATDWSTPSRLLMGSVVSGGAVAKAAAAA